MQDIKYRFIRAILYWFFVLVFLVATPVVVYFSLGYKFDFKSRKFLKTGAISIKSRPRSAKVYINGKKIKGTTPCIIDEVNPGEYRLLIKKKHFYPYSVEVKVNPSQVTHINAEMVYRMRNEEKIKFNYNIYRFFADKSIFGCKFIVFTNKGIFIVDSDFNRQELISAKVFPKDIVLILRGLKESGNNAVFWDKDKVWLIKTAGIAGSYAGSNNLNIVYSSGEDIKNVFFGLGNNYLIIHDGLKVLALDIKNKVKQQISALKSVNAQVYYDSRHDNLYIRDRISQSGKFSLFKLQLKPPSFYEKRKAN